MGHDDVTQSASELRRCLYCRPVNGLMVITTQLRRSVVR